MSETSTFYPPNEAPNNGSVIAVLSFDDVQERLVEAIRVVWRQPDRERAWLTVRAYWPDIQRHTAFGDYDERGGDGVSSDVKLRPAALTRREVGDAEEALSWLSAVMADDDRLLIGKVLRQMAARDGLVAWASLRDDRRRWRTADGLRMRYRRSMAAVVKRANKRLDAQKMAEICNRKNV